MSKSSEKKFNPDKYTKEDYKRALWHAGDLWHKMQPQQRRVDDSYITNKGMLFVAECSRRFGKTFYCGLKAIERCLQFPKQRVKHATAALKDVEEFAVPVYQEIMEDMPFQLRPTWYSAKKKWIFKNGSELALIGLDKRPDAGRGNYCDMYIFDEAGYVEKLKYIYSSVVLPMTMNRPNVKIIMASTPPEDLTHSFITHFIPKAQEDGGYVLFTIDDHPAVSQEMKDRYRKESMSESDFLREYYCKHVVDSSRAIIPEFDDIQVQELERDDYYPFYHKYVAMDLGVVDLTVALFGYYYFKRATFVFEDEIVMNGPDMTTDDLAATIKAKEEVLWGKQKPYRRVSDSDNLLLIQDLGIKHGIHFIPTTKSTLEQMVNDARMWHKDKRVIVSPKCKHLVGGLKTGIWDRARRQFDRSEIYGHYDALAAHIYAIRNVLAHENPIPGGYGAEISTHEIPQQKVETDLHRNLRKMFTPRNK